MIVSLKDNHKAHLAVLFSQNTQVLQDFCKLALEYLNKGPNQKLYHSAAQKLQLETEVIQNAVEGLVNLLIECCRHQLNALDLRDTLLTVGFSEAQSEVLQACYDGRRQELAAALARQSVDLPQFKDLEWRLEAKLNALDLRDTLLTVGFSEAQSVVLQACYDGRRQELAAALARQSVDLPQFKDLEWRLEAKVGSRALLEQMTPQVTMRLSLDNSKGTEHLLLQADPASLTHITETLEAALREASSQHCRRVQRRFK